MMLEAAEEILVYVAGEVADIVGSGSAPTVSGWSYQGARFLASTEPKSTQTRSPTLFSRVWAIHTRKAAGRRYGSVATASHFERETSEPNF
jgi:hypothetical protein